MRSFARILFVWLALLAVPFQGFAATAALGCAHGTTHAPMTMMQAGHACHHHDAAASHHDGKCSNCAACCAGAVIAAPMLSVPRLPSPANDHLVTEAGPVPSFEPDHPERPPRFARA